jgi:hypothetical protein
VYNFHVPLASGGLPLASGRTADLQKLMANESYTLNKSIAHNSNDINEATSYQTDQYNVNYILKSTDTL